MKMSPRDIQIARLVRKLTNDFWADTPADAVEARGMDWEEYYDLTIYPIENDLNEFETDRLIQAVLGETPMPC